MDTLLGQVWEGGARSSERAARGAVDGPPLRPRQGEANFNVWYWIISVVVLFYGMRAWQGDQGYNAAAKNAHEAKMANILNGWRFRVLMLDHHRAADRDPHADAPPATTPPRRRSVQRRASPPLATRRAADRDAHAATRWP